jgi:hypothetical protein
MKDVLRAGEALAGDLIWTDETADRIREVFFAYPGDKMAPLRMPIRALPSNSSRCPAPRKACSRGPTMAKPPECNKRLKGAGLKRATVRSYTRQMSAVDGCYLETRLREVASIRAIGYRKNLISSSMRKVSNRPTRVTIP